MAQIDTGLGWEAKDSWLTSIAGIIANARSVGGPSFPGQPIPKGLVTAADICSGGFHVYKVVDTRTSWRMDRDFYFAAESEDVVIFYRSDMAQNKIRVVVASPTQGAVVTSAYYDNRTGTAVIQTSLTCTVYDSSSGLYWQYRETTLGGISGSNPSITYYNAPGYTSDAAGLADIVVSSVDIYKENAGYAVGCVAKWRTSANVVITSPILISSNTTFVDMLASASWNFAKYSARKYGITFYMGFYQDIDIDVRSGLPLYDISGPDEPYANLDELFNLICAPDQANVRVTGTVDPYPFDHTGEGGGEPNPDPEDDDIEEEDLPTLSFASAGFARIYRPNLQQINDLADYMWTDQTFLQTVINHLKQLLENPMDAVISLSLVPCVPPVGTDVPVKVMYVPTGVSMPPVTSQYVPVDCGTVNVEEMYGSALDYNPYTKVQLYLPYIGTVQLNTDEVMGMTMQVKYNIDVVTGVCCAYVRVYGTRKSDKKYHDDILYQFSGHCSINQPITSADFSSYINAAIAAAKVGIAAATGGAGAAAGAAASGVQAPPPAVGGSSSIPSLPTTALVPVSPSASQSLTPYLAPQNSAPASAQAQNVSFAELAKPGNINTVASAIGGKVDVMHTGGFGGNSGYLAAVRSPYLIITRPQIANPKQYGQLNGRPSMIYLNLGSCNGYTQVQSVYLTGFDATNPELAEISELLKGGVVL